MKTLDRSDGSGCLPTCRILVVRPAQAAGQQAGGSKESGKGHETRANRVTSQSHHGGIVVSSLASLRFLLCVIVGVTDPSTELHDLGLDR
jgi:hypothetical protein